MRLEAEDMWRQDMALETQQQQHHRLVNDAAQNGQRICPVVDKHTHTKR